MPIYANFLNKRIKLWESNLDLKPSDLLIEPTQAKVK
jgi:hypothetical protein